MVVTVLHLLDNLDMAIALDTTSTGTNTATTPLTWSHTCTGTNLMLIIGVAVKNTSGTPAATGVTYNGVAMTKARADLKAGEIETSIWMLAAPATGANTVSVAFSGGSGLRCEAGAASYTGAQQSSTPDAIGGLTGTTAGAQSFNVTTVADNAWVFSVAGIFNAPSASLTAGLTQRWNVTLAAADGVMAAEDTNAPTTPAGVVSVGWTTANGNKWAMSGASFAPTTGATTTSTSSTSTSSTSSSTSSTSTSSTSTSTTVSFTTSTSSTSSSTSTSSTSTSASTSVSTSSTSSSTSSTSSSISTSTSASTSISTSSTSISTTTVPSAGGAAVHYSLPY